MAANADLPPLPIPTNGMSEKEQKEWETKFYKLELEDKHKMFDAMSDADKQIIWAPPEIPPILEPNFHKNVKPNGGKKLRTRKNKHLRKRKSKSQKRRKSH